MMSSSLLSYEFVVCIDLLYASYVQEAGVVQYAYYAYSRVLEYYAVATCADKEVYLLPEDCAANTYHE